MDRAKQQTGRAGAAAAERRAKGEAAMREEIQRKKEEDAKRKKTLLKVSMTVANSPRWDKYAIWRNRTKKSWSEGVGRREDLDAAVPPHTRTHTTTSEQNILSLAWGLMRLWCGQGAPLFTESTSITNRPTPPIVTPQPLYSPGALLARQEAEG